MNANKCKHDACHCEGNDVQADGYCSDSCRNERMEGGNCACGHPECG
jgi:hypothetical protein